MKGKKLLPLVLAATLALSLFLFAACSSENGKSPSAHVHSAQHTAAVAPTCTTAGNIDYWYCSGCGKYFSDENCTKEIKGSRTLPAGHTFPTGYQTSATEHWRVCEKCTEEDRASHEFGNDNKCKICGYTLQFTEGLQYENINSTTCKVTGIGTATEETDIIIPAAHNGRMVVEIGYNAFYNCSNLMSIEIPASVTSIGGWYTLGAFKNCTNLQTVTFAGKSKLESIGNYAFCNCSKLTEITIPESITSIGWFVFDGCSNLQPSTIESNAKYLGNSQNPYLYLWDMPDKTITTFTINEKTKFIGYHAFEDCSSLIEITIPESVTSICGSAFRKCSSLANIAIPESVTSIGQNAFDDCSSLTSIEIPKSVTTIDHYAFESSGLTEITIPSGVTSIGIGAFKWCSNLRTVTFAGGSKLKSIDERAFENCDSLTEITIPASVTSINGSAFDYCDNLERIDVVPGNTAYSSQDGILYNYGKTKFVHIPKAVKGAVIIPNEITSIGNKAFYYCKNLTSITIPTSVTSIGSSAFEGCTGLQTVDFKNPTGWKVSRNGGEDILSSDLQNQSKAAEYLRSTYRSYSWQRT